ncbi:HyaD/HybD family hydrogenase maturation endopeptidase [Mangrovimicrobium sediminis]|uniref:HyaD/HybD family hydrogenase maturation endopeptidase n=1 Tax=Mangrovimicrobium sediminis TaxID=2562682 RepID=A0A4Z0M4E2_9GAMM|nr:HyaD/HybD family hydrogenase maturation endopeptidase [Haliea sp. SAOS-164]TGD74326.1 HyaD/HybD family hydrogenase maturation endopeptidase [Haliea sp. SAOS-164]
MTDTTSPKVLILGIGNLLWADEGFGVRAVETLQREYRFAGDVTLLDGGTQGIYLVQYIRDADILVVFDAVDYGLPGGTLKLIEGDEVPKFLGAKKVSLHQTGFQEVLALAEMMGDYPRELLLVGVQPVAIEDFGGSLRPEVKAQLPAALDAALDYLAQRGIRAQRREAPLPANVDAAGAIADMTLYENERPAEEQACRTGDARVLNSSDYQVEYRPADIDGVSVALDQHLDGYRERG